VQDPSYHALPHLFVIVDEFAQLAKEMPDFMRELVRIAQVGRSLGLHLILGTQSPMDVITDEMNANLQFRICLRVQNIEASRAMLRRPDAAYLPVGWPGRGYFQVGERGLFTQFQTAYVGGDYVRGRDDATGEPVTLELITDSGEVVDLLPESFRRDVHARADSALRDEPYTTARAICETIFRYSREQHLSPVRPLLLPPLEERVTLGPVFKKAQLGGWNGREWLAPGRDPGGRPIRTGSAPVGLIDDVYNRTQHPLWIHLNTGEQEQSRDGHVLIIGAPAREDDLSADAGGQRGAPAPARPPAHVFLSFTGGGLNDVGQLPHAESVVHGTETERVRRLFRRLIDTLIDRQAVAEEMDSTQPTIMLCVDQFEQFRDTYYEHHMADFERLVNEAVGGYLRGHHCQQHRCRAGAVARPDPAAHRLAAGEQLRLPAGGWPGADAAGRDASQGTGVHPQQPAADVPDQPAVRRIPSRRRRRCPPGYAADCPRASLRVCCASRRPRSCRAAGGDAESAAHPGTARAYPAERAAAAGLRSVAVHRHGAGALRRRRLSLFTSTGGRARTSS
jgi:hypothetical protein